VGVFEQKLSVPAEPVFAARIAEIASSDQFFVLGAADEDWFSSWHGNFAICRCVNYRIKTAFSELLSAEFGYLADKSYVSVGT
jgi:hypothetical protein